MQIVIVDSKTKKINERLTHRYWNAMRNSTFMDIPEGMRLSIRSDKDSVKSGNKVSKYSCNR